MFFRLSASVRMSASRESYDTRRKAALSIAYEAPGWLPGGHLQTIYAYYLKQTASFTYRRERWETPDCDFIDRLVGVVLARLQPVSVVSRPRRMFTEPLRGQRNEPTAPRGLERRRAAFSWLRR